MEGDAEKLKEEEKKEDAAEGGGKAKKGKKGKKKKSKKVEDPETGEVVEEEEMMTLHDLRKSFTELPNMEDYLKKHPPLEKKKGEEGPQDSNGFLNVEMPCMATIGNEVHDNYFDFV